MEFYNITELEKRKVAPDDKIGLGGFVSQIHGPTQIGSADWRYYHNLFILRGRIEEKTTLGAQFSENLANNSINVNGSQQIFANNIEGTF